MTFTTLETSLERLSLLNLPPDWQLTPVNLKAPYLKEWEKTDVTRDSIARDIDNGRATGYGLRLGKPSGYLLAIDFDGQSAIDYAIEKFGELPKTVSWTSGRPARYQALFQVSTAYQDRLKSKKFTTEKGEAIEFRYTGNQSVLPPSKHPETDGYVWINNPLDTPIADLPQLVIDYLLELTKPKPVAKTETKSQPVSKSEDVPPIPLENCLAKSNRQLLKGVTEPGRNDAGAKLARDLVGCANYLESEGTAHDGDPRELFDRFVSNCEPPLDSSEADTIWRSAEGDNPEPSCTAEGIQNIIEAWDKKHTRLEVEQDDPELTQNIDNALKMKSCRSPNLFGGNMGRLLREAADNFNIPTSILEFIALPVLASRIDSRTKLLINPGTDYWVPAVRWCGLVGETGTMKSPVIKRLTKPMSKHQHEIAEIYKVVKQEYDLAHSSWKANKSKDKGDEPQAPPPMLDLYFSNFTIEALVDSIHHYPEKGYLLLNDELAQFYKSLDMYRGGKGADRQQWLTIWDAGGLKNNRKSSGSIFIPQVSISIVGGVQPQTIRNMISSDDSNLDGLWHRFSYVGLPDTTIEAFTELTGDLTDELDKVYTSLSEQSHQIYWLSIEAKPLWAEWHDEMQSKRMSATQEMLKGVYPKFEGICGRNALILHCTYAAIAGTAPDQLIPASTVETAIAWTKWELSQTLLQYQMLGLTDDPELSRILKFIEKFSGKGWVKPSDARVWWSTKPKPSFDELKAFMSKVISLGYAIDNGEPIDSSKYQIKILEKSSQSSHNIAGTFTQQPVQERLPVVTDFSSDLDILTQGDGLSVVTTDSQESSHSFPESIVQNISDDPIKTVTTNGHESSHNSEPTLNGHHSDLSLKTVTIDSHSVNTISSNSSGDVVTTLTTFPDKNIFKIGDYAKAGNDIVIITEVKKDYISGLDKDLNPIGGHPNSFTIASAEEFAATQGELDDEWN